ncbi:MAG: hypothetical protein H6963_08935 [Chromatiaceae bacterium]|nr:hypothetical protein [Chromatiaceae bacterium]MCP5444361.1 hypothetical protein [Chromatiaceae bacterium]
MTRDEAWKTANGNRFNIFWRAALGMAYLYLNFAAYQLIGIEGVAITSGFFLIAQFSPFIVRTFNRRATKQIEQTPVIFTEPGEEQADESVTPFRLASETEQKSM